MPEPYLDGVLLREGAQRCEAGGTPGSAGAVEPGRLHLHKRLHQAGAQQGACRSGAALCRAHLRSTNMDCAPAASQRWTGNLPTFDTKLPLLTSALHGQQARLPPCIWTARREPGAIDRYAASKEAGTLVMQLPPQWPPARCARAAAAAGRRLTAAPSAAAQLPSGLLRRTSRAPAPSTPSTCTSASVPQHATNPKGPPVGDGEAGAPAFGLT